MTSRSRRRANGDAETGWLRGLPVLAGALCVATLALVWFGWAATRDQRRSASLRVAKQTQATMVLLGIALDRDMQGAWVSVLVPVEPFNVRDTPPYDFQQVAARAFTRFSYLESFVVWNDTGSAEGRTYVLNRADRRISWDPAGQPAVAYPVILLRDPRAVRDVVGQLRRQAQYDHRFALIETTIDGVPYQVVAHLMFQPDEGHRLVAFVGFLVNLDWVRRYYFAELLHQIATLAGGRDQVSLAITDADGRPVAASEGEPAEEPTLKESFPLLFFDRRLVRSLHRGHAPIESWTACGSPGRRLGELGADGRPADVRADRLRGVRGDGRAAVRDARDPESCGAGRDEVGVRVDRYARAEDAAGADQAGRGDAGTGPVYLRRGGAGLREAAVAGDVPPGSADRQPAELLAHERSRAGVQPSSGSASANSSKTPWDSSGRG